ncbi:hypothetical protein PRK78_001296 [Emydomyces testavorans]|uniref:Cyclase n=1 Tax=Emydomyces testavorans TaxID=2070801 RepID=A0AAF0DCP6_9EURO|nr:hypothetical protein PRK78_001296 [Emydomyces testavorans]
MSAIKDKVAQAIESVSGSKSPDELPWHPDNTKLPTRKNLPSIPGAPEGAAWVWGKDDYVSALDAPQMVNDMDMLGRLNLLTPARVKAAAAAEIKTGELVPLNLPLNVPETPAFGREKFVHTIKPLLENIAYDDKYELNTQSGTQWDGFRHTKGKDILGPEANHNCSIHHWANHGIAGRGVLLDYWAYAKANGVEYDPYTSHAITFDELYKCGKAQGIDIRPEAQGGDIKVGDILMIRSGFVDSYYSRTPEERTQLALRPHVVGPDDGQRYAGVAQEDAILDWLHDCYFAAVVGDAPAFERWPSLKEYYVHEYILALWGMPLGEMWDLEKLAAKCREANRWSFFMTSAPANVPAGVSSHANATAIF